MKKRGKYEAGEENLTTEVTESNLNLKKLCEPSNLYNSEIISFKSKVIKQNRNNED